MAWVIWLISAAALVLWLVLGGLSKFADGPVVALLFSSVLLSYLVVGLLIATRQRRNPIGWLLLLGAFCAAMGGFTGAYAAYSQIVRELPGAAWAGWIANWAGTLGFGIWLYFIFLYFPNGKLVSPRWRLVVGLAVFTLLLGVLPAMFSPEYLEGLPGEADPMRFDWSGWNFIIRLQEVFMPMVLIAGMVSVMLRYRHATSTERLQIKWVAYSAILGAILTVMGVLGIFSG